MRKILVGIGLVFWVVSLTGCENGILPEGREIDDLQLVQVIGIDKLSDGSDDCMVTVASKNLDIGIGKDSSGGMGGSTGGSTSKALVLSARGKTMFDAVRNIQTHSNKTIFWGHSEYYLIGEDAARENIADYIDFFTRDYELRIESKVYVVKGSTAKHLIEEFNHSDFYIADKLESLGNNLKLLSFSKELRVHELIKFLDIHFSSARIPCIHLVTRDTKEAKNVTDLECDGYAIVSDLKLVGFIGRDISRGINFITNTVDSSIVTVKDPTGQDVSLEVIDSNTKVIPRFKGDTLESILLKTKVISNLGEIQSQREFSDESTISFMESQASEIIKTEMEKALEEVVKLKSDCLEICDRISLRRPLKWHKIKDEWIQIFPNVKIDIEVDSKILRTYELVEPSGYRRRE